MIEEKQTPYSKAKSFQCTSCHSNTTTQPRWHKIMFAPWCNVKMRVSYHLWMHRCVMPRNCPWYLHFSTIFNLTWHLTRSVYEDLIITEWWRVWGLEDFRSTCWTYRRLLALLIRKTSSQRHQNMGVRKFLKSVVKNFSAFFNCFWILNLKLSFQGNCFCRSFQARQSVNENLAKVCTKWMEILGTQRGVWCTALSWDIRRLLFTWKQENQFRV